VRIGGVDGGIAEWAALGVIEGDIGGVLVFPDVELLLLLYDAPASILIFFLGAESVSCYVKLRANIHTKRIRCMLVSLSHF
jgi:hypothetical protein